MNELPASAAPEGTPLSATVAEVARPGGRDLRTVLSWPDLPRASQATPARETRHERDDGASRQVTSVGVPGVAHRFPVEDDRREDRAAVRRTTNRHPVVGRHSAGDDHVAARRLAAESTPSDLGEWIDRWPTLPDPVPDDDSSRTVALEPEHWARLDREQRTT